jgi:hypothetical protein
MALEVYTYYNHTVCGRNISDVYWKADYGELCERFNFMLGDTYTEDEQDEKGIYPLGANSFDHTFVIRYDDEELGEIVMTKCFLEQR